MCKTTKRLSGGDDLKNAASIKSQIKYRAKKEKRDVQDMFILYVLEKILFRISISKYKKQFILKGGCLLYGLFDEQYTRTTTDIDLLGIRISNDAEYMKKVFLEILSIEHDDAIKFDINTLSAKNITEFKEYHGVNISAMAYLDRTRIPINIDIGYNDIIFPEKKIMNYPTILNDEAPVIYVYSNESIIAEKFEAIVSLGVVNSRYKDFYDICTLANHFNFKGVILKQAIVETFNHRGTSFDRIVIFEDGFADDTYRKGRWAGFIKTKRADTILTLEEAILFIKSFIEPVVFSIKNNKSFKKTWNHSEKKWL